MAYTRLRYHMIFATKKRARWIWPDVEAFLYPVLIRQAELNDGRIIRIGGIEDHVHLICALKPRTCVSDFAERIKSNASKAVRKEFANLYGFAWQKSYGCFTLNPFEMDEIVAYVENQKAHHRDGELLEIYERVVAHAPTFE